MMKLEAYLQRIGYEGPLSVNVGLLHALHQQHLLAIPYENIDIHLGQTLTLELEQIFDKVVNRQRGGWCYEMNGLFAWALREIGFDVDMLSSRVGGPLTGTDADLDHLILSVEVNGQRWLADVGFGNAFLEPLPLEVGKYVQNGLHYLLENDGDVWTFHNHQHDSMGYSFTLKPHLLADFAARCHWLQSDPASGFVQKIVCHRFTQEEVLTLRNAQLRRVSRSGGIESFTIKDAEAYLDLLGQDFALDIPEVARLWNDIWQKHEAWLATIDNG